MGLIKAGIGSVGGVLADQWKEFFYCDALPNEVLMRKGQKKTSGRSSNTKGEDNIISNGSGIAVADGQCMIIVEQGKIVEFCAEPGEFTYDSSTEPSLFAGKLGKSIVDTFKTIGKRFAHGGDTGKDQRVYYFNTKEILNNKFGTPSPIMFRVVNREINMSKTVQVRCNGTYTYIISDPLLFYTRLCGNVEYEYRREQIDSQLKSEFIDALQPALGSMSSLGLHPADLPSKAIELKQAMNEALKTEWAETRGLSVGKITLNPITLSDEDMKAIAQMEDAASMGSNPFMMAGRMTNATANAMETAAANESGAMNGFIGMNMAGGAMGGGFNAAQQFYNMGAQQVQQAANQPAPTQNGWKCSCGATATGKFCTECGSAKPNDAQGWTCSCGAVNKGKFCPECGAKKPAGAPLYRCDKCGWEPEDPHNPPKFCQECGDRFDENDIK